MEKLAERLKELVVENKIENIETFCNKIEVGKTDFYRWWSNATTPTLENIIKLAGAFNCSIEFLVGREEESPNTKFKDCPPFWERLHFFMQKHKTNPFKLSRESNLGRTSINEWLNNKSIPTLESLIRLADFFDCSLDYLVGRE